ncbi:MAG: DUF362 domain-containing protein [bacterium]|nr:DUF362 domain-containing protein [bacterium]
MTRREFIRTAGAGTAGLALSLKAGLVRNAWADDAEQSLVLRVANIPENPFVLGGNHHAGLDTLLHVFSAGERRLYRSVESLDLLAGPDGIIRADDVVVIKVNAQWCYRGATNTDVLRGLIQRIIEHPDGFTGEIVIIENGQGRGSFDCDQDAGDLGPGVHANALDPSQSFNAVIAMFAPHVPISAYLLDGISGVELGADDQVNDGYVRMGFVTYPRITTAFGTRIDLKNGIWNGSAYEDRLRLISIPVLKDHGGAWVTAALKLSYGILSMHLAPSGGGPYHYDELGTATGTIWSAVRPADMHILDAIYSVKGGGPYCGTYNESLAPRTATLMASVDPVALDYVASKYVLHPVTGNPLHHPDGAGRFSAALAQAESVIRANGRLANAREQSIARADGVRGTINLLGKRHREGKATAEDVRRLLGYYHGGGWVS